MPGQAVPQINGHKRLPISWDLSFTGRLSYDVFRRRKPGICKLTLTTTEPLNRFPQERVPRANLRSSTH
ncbi:hypothetical protein H9L39_13189 [Fusarium oxysporum f. sp. albedinis]|nr:hypothetical protein H9L39_13189 [Fusarium oxysporum f. sp. albedinis]